MKKILIAIAALLFSLAGQSQKYIHGSVKKNADPAKIDIVFKPNYTSAAGEYINFFQFSLAIPLTVSGGVTATAVGVGTFSNMGTLFQNPPTTDGAERIFSWIFAYPYLATQSWTNGVDFIGVEISFSTTAAAGVGKMVDFSNIDGGGNGNALFVMASNTPPFNLEDPSNLFFAIPGQSYLGIDPNGDQFVQTEVAAGCMGAVGGTATGSTSLCVSGTPTITASGFSYGAGIRYQWMSSTSPGDYPSAGSPVASQINPTRLTTGYVSVTTYYWLKVTCPNGTATDYSNMITVTVNPSPVVTCPANSSISMNAASFALTGGLPAGGTYSGPGVSSGNFNPAAAGAGVKTITYTYANPTTGCSNSCSFTITVNTSGTVTCPTNLIKCINTAAFALAGGSPAGGTYSGTGVSSGNFDPATAGVGVHTITYSTLSGSCTFTISVNILPVITCPDNFSVSINTAPFALSATLPYGVTFSGPGVSGNYFNPSVAGLGVKTITYTWVNQTTGCSSSCTFTITVNDPLPPQFIHGSVKKNADPAKIDIVFKPNYTSASGEYVNFLQFALTIPFAVSGGVTATAVGVGPFANMGTIFQNPPSTDGAERTFTWIFADPTPAIQSWTNGVDFTGIEVTFSTTSAAAVGKMVDFSNLGLGGGSSENAYFVIVSNKHPFNREDPSNFFYAIPGQSFTGTYPNGDQFVQTDMVTGCAGAIGGTAVGSTSFYVSGTPTVTASGYSFGAGSGYQWMSSASPGDYPLAGSPIAGQTNPVSLTTGVVSATTYYWLKVTCASGSSTDYSNLITVSVTPAANVFANPNPSSGQFQVRVFGQNQPLVLTVYDSNGLIVYKRSVTTGNTPYSTVDVTLPNTTTGHFILDVRDASGKQIGKKQIMILR